MKKNKLINPGEKIFVAGSNGMVGSAVCRILKESGYGLKKNDGQILNPTRSELDLCDFVAVNRWFKLKKPTVVILAAAKVGGIYANSIYPAEFILENLKIQNNVIEAAWNFGVKRLLFLGSSCIYPKFTDQPITEDALLTGVLETTNEPYAIAKIAGIKLCQALRKQYNFDAISLMPTNLYGTGDNYHPKNSHVMPALISKFINAKNSLSKKVICWGTGEPLREFLHVDDLGRAIVFALENWDPNSNNAPSSRNHEPDTLLNVGTGKDISIKELALKISEKVGFKGEIFWDKSKPNGTPKKLLNVDKLKKMGWEPLISLNEGISRTINEFNAYFPQDIK